MRLTMWRPLTDDTKVSKNVGRETFKDGTIMNRSEFISNVRKKHF